MVRLGLRLGYNRRTLPNCALLALCTAVPCFGLKECFWFEQFADNHNYTSFHHWVVNGSQFRPCRWPPGVTAPPRTPLAPPLAVHCHVNQTGDSDKQHLGPVSSQCSMLMLPSCRNNYKQSYLTRYYFSDGTLSNYCICIVISDKWWLRQRLASQSPSFLSILVRCQESNTHCQWYTVPLIVSVDAVLLTWVDEVVF